jgi:translation elongation factor EF-1beta
MKKHVIELESSSGQKKTVSIEPSQKEIELLKKLVDIYRERVGNLDHSSTDLNKVNEIVAVRERLTETLISIDEEIEANKLRKETIKLLLDKSESFEGPLRDTATANKKPDANSEEMQQLRQELNNEVLQFSLGFKLVAARIMLLMKNYTGAMDMVQNTIDLYHKNRICGEKNSGETLLERTLFAAKDIVMQSINDGAADDANKLAQISIENALEAAKKIEESVQAKVFTDEKINIAFGLRKIAVAFASIKKDYKIAEDIIDSAVSLYEEKGYNKTLVAELLELGVMVASTKSREDSLKKLLRDSGIAAESSHKRDHIGYL